MADPAVMITRPIDNNPITQLLLRHGSGGEVEPPEGYALLVEESNKLLRDERGSYLIEQEENV